MAVVADFLKGTVDESLKKILQPAGLVPATILVLLNLGFLYPTARNDVPTVKAFAGLDEAWQLIVAAALILAIGYLLLHAANWIIAVLAGQTWRASALNWLLRAWQLRQREELHGRLEQPRDDDNRAGLRWQLATRFPTLPNPRRYIQPTRLGNTLVATQHILSRRYGIDMAALWSQMESAEAVKDAPAIAAVKDAKATLDLLANLVFVLIIFVVEAVIYFGYRERWDDVLISFLALPLAYVTYRVADTSARSWGNAVEVTLDLHRDKLREELGLRATKGAADERQQWQKASRFFLPGSDEPAGDLFDPATPMTAEITAAPSLQVDKVAADVVDRVAGKTASDNTTTFDLRSVEYLVIVSRKDEAARWAGADFVVEDARVAQVAATPAVVREGAVEAVARVQPAKDGTCLRWHVTGLQQGASLSLSYRLPLWQLIVTGDVPEPKLSLDGKAFRLFIPGAGGKSVELAFVYASVDLSGRPTVSIAGNRVRLRPKDGLLKSGEITMPADNPTFRIRLPEASDA